MGDECPLMNVKVLREGMKERTGEGERGTGRDREREEEEGITRALFGCFSHEVVTWYNIKKTKQNKTIFFVTLSDNSCFRAPTLEFNRNNNKK
jgi:hypothetical protein